MGLLNSVRLKFNNRPDEGRSYRDHLDINFREFVKKAGGGSKVVRCHPDLVYLFEFIGIKPKVDPDMPSCQATVGGTRIAVENVL